MASELLTFQPSELKFPFELKKQISCSLRLINTTDDLVAFKVKTTSPKKYSVRPNAGTVAPQSSMDIIITMQAQRESPPDMLCKDKFLVQSVKAPDGLSANSVTQELFDREKGKAVFENKLKVIYVSPPQPPSPVPESAEEGVSPTKEDQEEWTFEQQKDPEVLENQISEARAQMEVLRDERNLANKQSQQLQQELAAKGSETIPKGHARFSFLFVFLVGFLGLLVGYYFRH